MSRIIRNIKIEDKPHIGDVRSKRLKPAIGYHIIASGLPRQELVNAKNIMKGLIISDWYLAADGFNDTR